MLVLSRKLGQVLRIGDDIRVTVQSIGLGQAVFRIDCPPEITIWPPRGNRTQVDGARIISRSVNETLLIGQEIKIEILSMRGRQARIGITAPENVAIHRSEIYDRIAAAAA